MPIKTREAEKMLLNDGWELVKGGKGSHRRYKKGNRFYTLPYHGSGKDLSPRVEQTFRKLFK